MMLINRVASIFGHDAAKALPVPGESGACDPSPEAPFARAAPVPGGLSGDAAISN